MNRIQLPLLLVVTALTATSAQADVEPSTCMRALTHPAPGGSHFLPTPAADLLRRIAEGCAAEFPALSLAARRGALLSRAERSQVLGDAATEDLGGGCGITAWTEPASALAPSCLEPFNGQVSPPLLRSADSGTALFAATLLSHLHDPGDTRLAAVFRSLIIASALESISEPGARAAR
jgi:hypothetical protein